MLQIDWDLKVLDLRIGDTGSLGEKALGAMKTTNNTVNPQMASTPGFEPGPHWRGVLSIVRQHCFPYPSPPLLSHIGIEEIILAC